MYVCSTLRTYVLTYVTHLPTYLLPFLLGTTWLPGARKPIESFPTSYLELLPTWLPGARKPIGSFPTSYFLLPTSYFLLGNLVQGSPLGAVVDLQVRTHVVVALHRVAHVEDRR